MATFYVSTVKAIEPLGPDTVTMKLVRSEFNSIPRQPAGGYFEEPLGELVDTCGDTCRRDERDYRIITYNILAEPYALSDFAVNHIYPYCDPKHLETEYRMQRVLEELVAADADIIALQECDSKSFSLFLEPALRLRGFVGRYTNKSGGVSEGCALFIKSSRLTVIEYVDVPVKDILRNAEYMRYIYSRRPDLQDVLGGKLGTIGQVVVCRDVHRPHRVLVLGNTHLFYHPNAGYVRLLQTSVILSAMSALKAKWGSCADGASAEGANASAIFMGDLNSTSETAAIEYLERGYIGSDHPVWLTVNDFRWGQRMEGHPDDDKDAVGATEDEVVDLSSAADLLPCLSHSLNLTSAAGYPPYTNFTSTFKDVLDYIFIPRDDFEAVRVAPFPSFDQLSQHTALPSIVFPSDHIAVVVDIRDKIK
jgi:2',5'-phosphodiesterase